VGAGNAGDMSYSRVITIPQPAVSRIHSMKAFYSPNWHMRWAAINMSIYTGYTCRIFQLLHSSNYYCNVFIITIETQEAHCDVMSWAIIGYEKCSQSVAHINK
jgi:hypothetical protein